MAETSRIADFRNMPVDERRTAVADVLGTDVDLFSQVNSDSFGPDDAANLSENVFGVFSLPLGVATNFTINGTDVLIPMATEEASVIAAASNAARIARPQGGFSTSSTEPVMQAQIQLINVADPHAARTRILERQAEIIDLANDQDPKLVEVGGGVKGLEVRLVEARTATYVLVHLLVDVRDAMGANAVNTMAEAVSGTVAAIAEGDALLRILTNKADRRLSRARAVFDRDLLGGDEVIDNILHAYELAAADPYRAATHNKGIMNGISAVVLATGNDTRAVEAGAHSHAVVDGRYSSLSTFEKNADGDLVGTSRCRCPSDSSAEPPGFILHAPLCRSRRSRPPKISPKWSSPPAWLRTSPPCGSSPPKAFSADTCPCMRRTSPRLPERQPRRPRSSSID